MTEQTYNVTLNNENTVSVTVITENGKKRSICDAWGYSKEYAFDTDAEMINEHSRQCGVTVLSIESITEIYRKYS